MVPIHTSQDYTPFAWVYNKYWGQEYSDWVLPGFEKLLLKQLPPGASILELGCGTGHLARQLLQRGFRVNALDGSEAMLQYARQNAPEGHFTLGDVRSFRFPPQFHGVLSTGTLNHVMTLADLTEVFRNAHEALLDNGLFVFDTNLAERYERLWRGSIDGGDVQPDYAWASRSIYDSQQRVGQVKITLFQLLADRWQRTDLTWQVRDYSAEELRAALVAAGFVNVQLYDAEQDLGLSQGSERLFLVGQKQLNETKARELSIGQA